MTCPYCAYALANAGSPCPRCGQLIEGNRDSTPSKASASKTRPYSTTPRASGPLQSQAAQSTPQTPVTKGNMTPLGAFLVISGVLGLTYILILVTPDSTHPSTSASTSIPATQSQSQPVAVAPVVAVGPTFQQVDSMMDDRRIDLTDAQRQQYWNTVVGTVITWTGVVHNVYLDNGGQMSLQCNPASILSDVRVSLDGTQMSLLPQIRKGQQVTVRATLDNHHSYGYNLVQGQIVN